MITQKMIYYLNIENIYQTEKKFLTTIFLYLR